MNRSFTANAYTLGYGRNLNDEDDLARNVIAVGKMVENSLVPERVADRQDGPRFRSHLYDHRRSPKKGDRVWSEPDNMCMMPITRFFEDFDRRSAPS